MELLDWLKERLMAQQAGLLPTTAAGSTAQVAAQPRGVLGYEGLAYSPGPAPTEPLIDWEGMWNQSLQNVPQGTAPGWTGELDVPLARRISEGLPGPVPSLSQMGQNLATAGETWQRDAGSALGALSRAAAQDTYMAGVPMAISPEAVQGAWGAFTEPNLRGRVASGVADVAKQVPGYLARNPKVWQAGIGIPATQWSPSRLGPLTDAEKAAALGVPAPTNVTVPPADIAGGGQAPLPPPAGPAAGGGQPAATPPARPAAPAAPAQIVRDESPGTKLPEAPMGIDPSLLEIASPEAKGVLQMAASMSGYPFGTLPEMSAEDQKKYQPMAKRILSAWDKLMAPIFGPGYDKLSTGEKIIGALGAIGAGFRAYYNMEKGRAPGPSALETLQGSTAAAADQADREAYIRAVMNDPNMTPMQKQQALAGYLGLPKPEYDEMEMLREQERIREKYREQEAERAAAVRAENRRIQAQLKGRRWEKRADGLYHPMVVDLETLTWVDDPSQKPVTKRSGTATKTDDEIYLKTEKARILARAARDGLPSLNDEELQKYAQFTRQRLQDLRTERAKQTAMLGYESQEVGGKTYIRYRGGNWQELVR